MSDKFVSAIQLPPPSKPITPTEKKNETKND